MRPLVLVLLATVLLPTAFLAACAAPRARLRSPPGWSERALPRAGAPAPERWQPMPPFGVQLAPVHAREGAFDPRWDPVAATPGSIHALLESREAGASAWLLEPPPGRGPAGALAELLRTGALAYAVAPHATLFVRAAGCSADAEEPFPGPHWREREELELEFALGTAFGF